MTAIVTTRNRPDVLPRAIESVLAQTRPVDEVIVVDDASTATTAEIVWRYEARRLVRGLRVETSRGANHAHNVGLAAASGEVVAFLDDDAWRPPKRERQFRALEDGRGVALVGCWFRRGEPVLSVDTKKKERVDAFKNPGRTWRPKGEPQAVNIYDFPTLGIGTAIPYGAYDVQRDEGFVNVGTSHDTAEFAVESLRRC